MKKTIFLKKLWLACTLLVASLAISQNPNWTLPPYFAHFTNAGIAYSQALPAPGGTYGYNGTYNYYFHPEGVNDYAPHSMYADTAGKPMFFIVDGKVYNSNGYLIDQIFSPYTMTTYSTSYGWTQALIVPDPGSCTQYYVFTAGWNGTTCYAEIGTSYITYNFSPVVFKLDLAQANPYVGGEFGKNISSAPTGYTANDLFTLTNTKWPAGDSGECLPSLDDPHYACTKLLGTGTGYRLLFLSDGTEIIVYKIDASGIHFLYNYSVGTINSITGGSDYTQRNLSELEIYEDIANNKIKMAFTAPQGSTGDIALGLAEFNSTTGAFTGTSRNVCFNDGGSCCTYTGTAMPDSIYGVEFSPDGSKVYFTHSPTHCHNHYIDMVDYATGASFTHITPTYAVDFRHSQIERGKDGNLYLVGNGATNGKRLAKITSPNTTPSFSDNAYSLTGTSYPNSAQPIFYLPTQIDNETYGGQLYSTAACCIANSEYDKFSYWTSSNPTGFTGSTQTWKPNTSSVRYNPLLPAGNTSNTVYIGEELRINAGYAVTIQNMTIKFSPQATFIVEGANGATNSAQLILKKCTLDVDNRCLTQMWPGVRVWGSNSAIRNNTTQGYILLDSSCVITNAWMGIELGYTTGATGDATYDASNVPAPSNTTNSGGGIINCQNSSFINNQRDIFFTDYTFGTGGTSSIFKNTFTTNAYLVGGSTIPPLYHVQVNNYKPNLLIYGNTFSCSTSLAASGYVYACEGLHSVNSNVTVDLSGSIKNRFSYFKYGIYASNTGGNTNTISVKNSTFTDNVIGAYFGNLINPVFQSDSVRVRQVNGICLGNGCGSYYAGLFLDNTTGYKVQFNNFLQTGIGTRYPFGVIASNSGAHVNCIFKNTFKDLFKGSQAQYRNFASAGSPLPHNYLGLIYLCNTFTGTIGNADIYIPATGSSANQGTAYTDTSAIMFNQGTQSASYPQVAGNTFSKTAGGSDFWIETTGKVIGSNYIYYCAGGGSCPGASNKPDNNSSTLVTMAAYSITDVNCSTDPYSNGLRVSNMVEFMLSKAADYKTTCDSISAAIGSLSANDSAEKYNLGLAFGNALSARHRLIDEAIHLLMEDTLNPDSSETIIHSLMKEKALELDLRSQLETAIAIHDSAMASQALSRIANSEGQSNYVKLHSILLQNLSKTPEQMLSNPSTLSQVQAMKEDSSDRSAYVKANLLLQAVGLSDYQPYYAEGEVPSDSSAARKGHETITTLVSSNNLFSKPNPFKESTTIKATVNTKTDNAYVVVTDMLGKEVGRYKLVQGENEINFTASDIDQQVFFCSLIIDGVKIKTNKMVLIK